MVNISILFLICAIHNKAFHFQECGADCVKLQLSSLTAKFNKAALNRPYDSEHAWGVTYGAHKKHLEFSRDQVAELQQFAAEVDIPLTASAMDIVSVSSTF